MNSRWRDVLIVGLFAGVMLFARLGATPLWDRDEPRNAGCAAEMLERSDWVTPVFNQELRAHKPVLLYWLMMTAYSAFGVSEFAARFWCAALSVVTCCLTYDLGRRMFDRQAGLWAGVILASSLLFEMAARAATPDAVLICCLTASLWAFVRAVFPAPTDVSTLAQSMSPPAQSVSPLAQSINTLAQSVGTPARATWLPSRWRDSALIGVTLGFAVLAKGPVGIVLPIGIMGAFAWWMRSSAICREVQPRSLVGRLRSFASRLHPRELWPIAWGFRPITVLGLAILIAAPWYVWVGLRTDGEFLKIFFWEHNVSRATQAMEGHRGPFGLFYVGAILIGFFPWSSFAGLTVWGAAQRIRDRAPGFAGSALAICWIAITIGLFSCAQTKLPSYVTPCYPALALLTGVLIREWSHGESPIAQVWWRAALLIMTGVGLTWLVAWPFIASRFLPGEAWLMMLGVPLAIGAATAWFLHERHQASRAASCVAITSALFVLGVFALAMPTVGQHQQNRKLLAVVQQSHPDAQVGAFGVMEPSWVFYGGRPIQELSLTETPRSAVVPAVMETEPSTPRVRFASHETEPVSWKSRPRPDAATFFEHSPSRFIITSQRHWSQLQQQLPPDAIVLAECSFFLKNDRLLLIGRTSAMSPRHSVIRLP